MSLWASGTPCSGPLILPFASARSAARAAFIASSASTRAKALSLGCHFLMRASSALVTSADETLRRRIAVARSARLISAGSLTTERPCAERRRRLRARPRCRARCWRRPGASPAWSPPARCAPHHCVAAGCARRPRLRRRALVRLPSARCPLSIPDPAQRLFDMRNWRFRQDAVTEIEDERPRPEVFQNFVNGAIERGAAGEQDQRVEIALHGNFALHVLADKAGLG